MKQNAFLLVVLFLTGCAGQMPPPGGPVDTVPPEIVNTIPSHLALGFEGNSIRFEFSEYVEKRSAEEAIFISPDIPEKEFSWSGRELRISFPGRLRDSTTYVVTVGNDVSDLRNRNKMSEAFTLAFSTGDKIDRGSIQGAVVLDNTAERQGITLFAYQLDLTDVDTLDPRSHKPHFMTQTNRAGQFKLSYLPFGMYRVYAVKDEYRNLLYDPEVDMYGVFHKDMMLTEQDTLFADFRVRMTIEDTTGVRLIKGEAVSRSLVQFEFSEDIDTTSLMKSHITIEDTLAVASIGIHQLYPLPLSRKTFAMVTDVLEEDKGYRLSVDHVTDVTGNRINLSASSITFTGSGQRDTIAPMIHSFSITDSSRNVGLSDTLAIYWNKAPYILPVLSYTSLKDSAKRDIPYKMVWQNGATILLIPNKELLPKMKYQLRIITKGFEDFSGNKAQDTAHIRTFETIDIETLSEISGKVVDKKSSSVRKSEMIVVAMRVDRTPVSSSSIKASSDKTYVHKNLQEGKYSLWVFEDIASQTTYDHGKVFPFRYSYRFSERMDTLTLRARWPIDGFDLEIAE